MAEIRKLSVGQALDKLRGPDVPESKMTRVDGEIDALNEEIQRLRATRRRLERDQRAGSIGCDTQEDANVRRGVTKRQILGIIVAMVIVISILAWGALQLT